MFKFVSKLLFNRRVFPSFVFFGGILTFVSCYKICNNNYKQDKDKLDKYSDKSYNTTYIDKYGQTTFW